MPRALARLRTWTRADYVEFVESAALAVAVEAAIRLVSLAAILRALDALASSTRHVELDATSIGRLVRRSSFPYQLTASRAHCLRRSLVLCVMLRRRSVPARVCFGVDRTAGRLTAHAWVAVADTSLDDTHPLFVELHPAWIG